MSVSAPPRPTARGNAPVLTAAAGAAFIASTATLVQLSGAAPITAAFYRCAYALPFLALLALLERGRSQALQLRLAALAGVFFAADLVCWHLAISAVGAGIATVLVNLQVVVVALVARADRRVLATIPVVVLLLGIVLVSDVVGGSGHVSLAGMLWGLGAAVTYAAFLLTLKEVTREQGLLATPLAVATLSATACTALIGLANRWHRLRAALALPRLAGGRGVERAGGGVVAHRAINAPAADGARVADPAVPARRRGAARGGGAGRAPNGVAARRFGADPVRRLVRAPPTTVTSEPVCRSHRDISPRVAAPAPLALVQSPVNTLELLETKP